MPHTFIGSDGIIRYRSKMLSLARATAFARCLQANSDRFCDVEITRSERSRREAYFVQFRPVNRDRQGALYEAEYNARKARGEAEGKDYIFWQDADRREVMWCFNPTSGETYEVTPFDCTCPDYQFRCDRAAIQCKHMHALQLQADAGMLGKTDKTTRTAGDRAALHERMREAREQDF